MKLIRFSDGEGFLSHTREYLEKNESSNNLMLGLAMNLENYIKEEPYLAVVEDEDTLKLAALMTPPQKIVIYTENEDSSFAMNMLIQNLMDESINVPGVIGPSKSALAFANAWSKTTGIKIKQGMSLRVYRLDKVNRPENVKGYFRKAKEEDIDLVAAWRIEFQRDAGIGVDEDGNYERALRGIRNGNFYFWWDGEPVSMAARVRPTRNGAVVGEVYTPDRFRNRGYASACVAALSQDILDSGYKFCSLFTDLANPTSNSIYMKIGYNAVDDFNEYMFE